MGLTVGGLERRRVESRPQLKTARHPDAAAAMELADWLQWLDLGGAAPNTVYTYSWTADKLLADWPDTRFDQFTDSELMFTLRKAPPKSRIRWAAVYRSWFRWGVKTRRITENPCEMLPDFKPIRQAIVEIFTVEEEAALRALPEPHGTLMALLFDTGIRKAEARNLTAKRVDFAREQLIVIDGAKGGKQRVVPISQDVAPFLLGRLDGMLAMEGISASQYLWSTRPGGGRVRHDRPITSPGFHGWWVNQIEAADVTYRKPHTTRHSFASRWYERGLHLGDIQLLLGHASIATTQAVYVHAKVEDTARRMAEIRGPREES